MVVRIFTLILFILIYGVTAAQPAFYASVNEEKVFLGSYFKLEYQLSNSRGSAFKPPSFKGFRVVSGPARSFQQTIVNGKTDIFESYTYTLLAEKIGTYTLSPATIIVNGKTLQSNRVSIKVLQPLKQEDLGGGVQGEDIFVRAELSTDTAYPGQQVLLDYKLYTRVNIDRYEIRAMPELKDFYTQGINLLRRTTQKVDIAGNIYNAQLLRRTALFPQRSGEFNIDPAHVLLMVPQNRRQRRSFLFNNYETKFVNTNSLKLVVMPLPEPLPPSFSGLVGNYTMECKPGNRRISTDDVLSYQIIVRGDGDPNLLRIPEQQLSYDLEVYDPSVSRENTDQHQQRLNHYAVLEYLYVAARPGLYKIIPKFSYFNPDSNSYIHVLTDTITYRVFQGQGTIGSSTDVSRMSAYELIESPPTNLRINRFFNTVLYWILVLVPVTVGLTYLIRRWWMERFKPADPPKTSKEIAIEQLQDLKSETSEIQSHRIEEILGDHLRHIFQIEEAEWSVNKLEMRMHEFGIASELTTRLVDLLNRCSFAAYSGMNTKMSHEIIEESIAILDEL